MLCEIFALISLILVAFVPTIVGGLQCFQCSTVKDKNCDDPFHNYDFSSIDCPTVCVKIRFEGTVEQGCFNNQSPLPVSGPSGSGCVSQYIPMKGMKTICRCSTPRCNGGMGRKSLVDLNVLLTGPLMVFLLVK
ncbi:uncharacterized protein LOC132562406 [Ylistrum balloti]|uniref:uncharacterized protein LOC132562406 n=1 Tax=Ylistrum balloti TaxID=509963 RepID=UPI0029059965|nr:uncharacterized protein LOC132562406 [Ylistrum balloti]